MTKSHQYKNLEKLKTVTCNSLSGKSKITFNIFISETNDVYFAIIKNTGGGHWSSEVISWNNIQKVLLARPKDNPITSIILYPLFKGRSVNTPSFLLAALKSCGLVIPIKGKKRYFELVDPKDFLKEMTSLNSRRASTPTQRKKAATPRKQSKSSPRTSRKKATR